MKSWIFVGCFGAFNVKTEGNSLGGGCLLLNFRKNVGRGSTPSKQQICTRSWRSLMSNPTNLTLLTTGKKNPEF